MVGLVSTSRIVIIIKKYKIFKKLICINKHSTQRIYNYLEKGYDLYKSLYKRGVYMQPDYKAIGKRVQERRIAKKLSQAELALKISVTSPHISNIERGKTKVSLPTLMDIARTLDATLDELVCDNLPEAKDIILGEFSDTLLSCNLQELGIISDVTKALLESMRNRQSMEKEQVNPKQEETE